MLILGRGWNCMPLNCVSRITRTNKDCIHALLLCPMSCVPNVLCVTGLSIPDSLFGFLPNVCLKRENVIDKYLFVFVMCFVYLMFSGCLDGPFLISASVSITCIYDILVLISNDIKSRKSFVPTWGVPIASTIMFE